MAVNRKKLAWMFQGVCVSGFVVLMPGFFIKGVWADWRVWVVFVLASILLTSQPKRQKDDREVAGSNQDDRWSFQGLTIAAILAFFPAYFHFLYLHRAGKAPEVGNVTWISLGVGSLGLFVRYWAIHYLGEWFTSEVRVSKEQKLIRGGIYKWIRHPSYSGALLFWGSMPFFLGLPLWAFLGWFAMGVGYHWRIRVEEAALLGLFGESYRNYQKQSWRLIPFLY